MPADLESPVAVPRQPASASTFAWTTIVWVSALLLVCYASVLGRLASVWYNDGEGREYQYDYPVPVPDGGDACIP